ncbi:MAG: double zinc ribbon domain-containing protein [Christensenellales bacterium]|jgi:hypothetical protein
MFFRRKCAQNDHRFTLLQTSKNRSVYKCERCGHIDFNEGNHDRMNRKLNQKYWGSIIDSTTFFWKEDMNPSDITELKLSYHDYPVIEYIYRGNSLIAHNRIKPRDGGQYFPPSFFDDKVKMLSDEERCLMMTILQQIPFESWHTDIETLDLMDCIGFSLERSFSCTLSNGLEFVYWGCSSEKVPPGFDAMVKTLSSMALKLDSFMDWDKIISEANIAPESDIDMGMLCGNCGQFVAQHSKYCSRCGAEADFTNAQLCKAPSLVQETMISCKHCRHYIPFSYRYCDHCGKKQHD